MSPEKTNALERFGSGAPGQQAREEQQAATRRCLQPVVGKSTFIGPLARQQWKMFCFVPFALLESGLL
jgi:hypothetical protein